MLTKTAATCPFCESDAIYTPDTGRELPPGVRIIQCDECEAQAIRSGGQDQAWSWSSGKAQRRLREALDAADDRRFGED